MALVFLLAGAAPAAIAQGTWKPQGPLEISIPSGPGGGTDHTARVMQKILQERQLVEVPVTVVNKSGGGGLVALNYLKQLGSNAHHAQVASAVLLSNHIVGRSTVNYSDLTPLALLQSEYVVLAVKSDSPIKTAGELVERLKRDPGAVSISVGTSLGGANHSAAAGLARAAGVDPRKLRTVVFKSSSEAAVAALGGHIDVTSSSASQVLTHVRSGAMRAIAVTAPKRLTGELAAVPTLKEHGMNVEVNNFRFLIGPSGLTAPQVAYWDQALARLVQSDEWKKDIENLRAENTYMNSREVRSYLDTEYAELKTLLTAMGMVK
ncbi:MAG: tripartite tricarboxylate transporter substrate binding protein [Burkholderiales bacterium]